MFRFAAIVGVFGCVHRLNVPSSVAGDVALRIVNEQSNWVCQISMIPEGGGQGDEWPLNQFLAGETKEAKVKPGTYAVNASGCPNVEQGYRGSARITIQGPTRLLIMAGPKGWDNDADHELAGYTTVRMQGQKFELGLRDCSTAGSWFDPRTSNASHCCSGRAEPAPNSTDMVCE